MEDMRLRLQQLEEKIWISAWKDREDAYKAHLKDYTENKDHIRRTFAKVRTVDLVGKTVDESGIAPLFTNLRYVRLVSDPKDYGYNVSHDEWRGKNGHVQLAAPTYVFSNDHIHLSPPVETRRAIVQVFYNAGFVNFTSMFHMKTITKLVFVFVESTTPVDCKFYDNRVAATRQLADYLAKRFSRRHPHVSGDDWAHREAARRRSSKVQVTLVGFREMLRSLPRDWAAISPSPAPIVFKPTASFNTSRDSIKKVLTEEVMAHQDMRRTITTPQERKDAINCIKDIRFETMNEWRSRVGEEEYHLATERIKA